MEDILGDEIGELLQQKNFQAIKEIQAKDESILEINKLPFYETPKGFFLNLIRSLQVSDDGKRLWGLQLVKYKRFVLLMQCLRTKKSRLFNYCHQNLTLSVMVAEDQGIVMTGGADSKVVLHCLNTGKTIKVLELEIKIILCLLKLGNVVVIAGEETLLFFDLIKQEIMEIPPIKIEFTISYLHLGMKRYSENHQQKEWSLIVGGIDSTKLISVSLPELINEKSTKICNLMFSSQEQ
jgi:hypothetical protein